MHWLLSVWLLYQCPDIKPHAWLPKSETRSLPFPATMALLSPYTPLHNLSPNSISSALNIPWNWLFLYLSCQHRDPSHHHLLLRLAIFWLPSCSSSIYSAHGCQNVPNISIKTCHSLFCSKLFKSSQLPLGQNPKPSPWPSSASVGWLLCLPDSLIWHRSAPTILSWAPVVFPSFFSNRLFTPGITTLRGLGRRFAQLLTGLILTQPSVPTSI